MMTDSKNEEIIDLTEVVEEGPSFAGKEKDDPFTTPLASPKMDFREEEKKPPGEPLPEKKPVADSGRPSSPGYEAEIMALQERWNARVEAWFAKEGIQILERVARETFPKIAEKVLRTEIDKMKTEIEEPE